MSLPLIEPSKVIVYSDLDGTLLDHHSYSFADASPSLNKLHAAKIPLVLNTSKTFAEVKVIHQELGLNTPFIVENGAAIFMPKAAFARKPKDSVWQDAYWVKTFASKRNHWLGLINKLSVEFGSDFEAFSDMSLRRVMEVTGLSEQNAELASQRMYGEPLLWTGSQEAQKLFIEKAKNLGASPLLGGRFLHICGDTNKGKALTWLNNEYERQWQVGALKSISLGDGNNDIAMLEAADIAVRILSPVNPPPTLTRTKGVITSTSQGPQGWHECIQRLLPELNII